MKKLKIILGTFILMAGASGCSSAYYQASSTNAYDDLYAVHDRTAIAHKQQAQAEARKAEAEARQAEWEARMAEARAQSSEEDYYNQNEGIVADTYESAYARRLNGFKSSTYRMPSSYYQLRYTNNAMLNSALSYSPEFYNVMVSGDQVWVEPKYVTSMFGSWGAEPYYNTYSWYGTWGNPYYSFSWWGYPRYSWWDCNWGIGYDPWYYGHHHSHWYGSGYWPNHGYYPGHYYGNRPSHNYRLDGGARPSRYVPGGRSSGNVDYRNSGSSYNNRTSGTTGRGNSTSSGTTYYQNGGRGGNSGVYQGGTIGNTPRRGNSTGSSYDRGSSGSSSSGSSYNRGSSGSSSSGSSYTGSSSRGGSSSGSSYNGGGGSRGSSSSSGSRGYGGR